MSSLPSKLDRQCFELFMRCAEFDSDELLRAVFTNNDLAPFADRLPESRSDKSERVTRVKAFLLREILADGRWLLLPFLDTLREPYPEQGELRGKLNDLYQRVLDAWKTQTNGHSEGRQSPQRLLPVKIDPELQLSQVRSNLIGYWVARVSLVRSRPKSGEQEYSLAQILSPEKDRFVYRGVGRAKDSQDIDFCWHAREAWVQPVDQRYRFVFHTDNRDILLGPDDTANIGFIDYDTSAGLRLGQGTFFDYSLSRARVTRKKMLLYRYDQLDDSEKTFFHDFFQNYPVLAYRVRMEQILRKVERDFSP